MQDGRVYRKGTKWMIQFWQPVLESGTVVKKRVARTLGSVSDRNRTESNVRANMAEEISALLAPINARTARPEATKRFRDFLETDYLTSLEREVRPSTYRGYKTLLNLVKPYTPDIALKDVRTSDVERILRNVAESKQRAKTTLLNLRNFLSGAFRYAIRIDLIDRNPVREVKTQLLKGKRAKSAHAYSLKEVLAMVKAVEEPAKTVLLLAALTGLRHSEIRGLRWEDFTGEDLVVRRSVWESWVGETKTEKSSAPVPCVPLLKKALLKHRKQVPGDGYIFEGSTSQPMLLHNLVRREIKPALDKVGLVWHGWHGFRRGLASNLYRLGVPDMVIQRILRHSNVATTQAHYVKTSDGETRAAMKTLEAAYTMATKAKKSTAH